MSSYRQALHVTKEFQFTERVSCYTEYSSQESSIDILTHYLRTSSAAQIAPEALHLI